MIETKTSRKYIMNIESLWHLKIIILSLWQLRHFVSSLSLDGREHSLKIRAITQTYKLGILLATKVPLRSLASAEACETQGAARTITDH